MNDTKMIKEEAVQDMAKFYLNRLFYGIPEIKVMYAKKNEMRGSVLGEFELEKNASYCKADDALIDYPGYKSRYKTLWSGFGRQYLNKEFSWMDAENHPQIRIRISKKCEKDLWKLTATLLHELLHYFFWYTGREYHDDSQEFLNETRKMGLPNNYDYRKWTGTRWVNTYDYHKMNPYIAIYLAHKINNLIDETDVA